MNDILDPEVINKLVLNRLQEFIDEYYGSYTAFASALDMTVSTITSMFNRESLPSGAVLAGIKRLHPGYDLNYIFQDLGNSKVVMTPVSQSTLGVGPDLTEALIKFLKTNEIKLSVTLNNAAT